MSLPSVNVFDIMAADPVLFEHLMEQAGFTLRDQDPLATTVQEEVVAAVASAITEDAHEPIRLNPQEQQLKRLAEQRGYVVALNEFFWRKKLPPDMAPEEQTDYETYRKGGIPHEEALRMALRFRRTQ